MVCPTHHRQLIACIEHVVAGTGNAQLGQTLSIDFYERACCRVGQSGVGLLTIVCRLIAVVRATNDKDGAKKEQTGMKGETVAMFQRVHVFVWVMFVRVSV